MKACKGRIVWYSEVSGMLLVERDDGRGVVFFSPDILREDFPFIKDCLAALAKADVGVELDNIQWDRASGHWMAKTARLTGLDIVMFPSDLEETPEGKQKREFLMGYVKAGLVKTVGDIDPAGCTIALFAQPRGTFEAYCRILRSW